MYCIYRITNLVNGKTYIGKHKYKDLNDNYMGSGTYLARAKEKYGIENFKKDILVFGIVKRDLINLLEKEYIKFYRSIGKAEYNIADGGEGVAYWQGKRRSDETIRKMSEANKGKKMSEESKKKISEHMKGKQNFLGVHHSEESKNKIRKAFKGKTRPEDVSNKIRQARKEMAEAYRKSGRKDWNTFQKEYKKNIEEK